MANKQQISIKRICFAVAFSLLVLNSIKLPPSAVPVIHVPYLTVEATATPFAILTKQAEPHEYVLAHERCHIRQYNHYGSVWSAVLNTYYLHKHGYADNPLEEQAIALDGFCAPERAWMHK